MSASRVLYHGTTLEAWTLIQREGLRPRIPKSQGGWGLIYLALTAESATTWGEIVLEVETGGLRLTTFGGIEGCEEWEVLCWLEDDAIAPERIRRHISA